MNWGYPSKEPCAVCGKHKNNQSEPRFGYTVCEDHQKVAPIDLRKDAMHDILKDILGIIEQTDPDRPDEDDRPYLSGADVVDALVQYEDRIRKVLA